MNDDEYREAARNMFVNSPADSVDDRAEVMLGNGGAWVAVWVWVPDLEETPK